jgi:hypothetical protein
MMIFARALECARLLPRGAEPAHLHPSCSPKYNSKEMQYVLFVVLPMAFQ